MTELRNAFKIPAARANSGVNSVHREQRRGLNFMRAFLWAAGLGWVLYGICMLVDGPFERLGSPMPTGGERIAALAEPLQIDGVAVAGYLPGQFVVEEARAAQVDLPDPF